MSPQSALPPDFELGPDNRSPFMRLKKKVQIWLAASPRVPSGFWRWRDIPKTIFAAKGAGHFRYENTDGSIKLAHPRKDFYLSRIQPWARWGITLQWPFFFNCWWIYKAKNVARYPTYQSDFGIDQMITWSAGYKRDAQKIYWLTWFGPGGNFE